MFPDGFDAERKWTILIRDIHACVIASQDFIILKDRILKESKIMPEFIPYSLKSEKYIEEVEKNKDIIIEEEIQKDENDDDDEEEINDDDDDDGGSTKKNTKKTRKKIEVIDYVLDIETFPEKTFDRKGQIQNKFKPYLIIVMRVTEIKEWIDIKGKFVRFKKDDDEDTDFDSEFNIENFHTEEWNKKDFHVFWGVDCVAGFKEWLYEKVDIDQFNSKRKRIHKPNICINTFNGNKFDWCVLMEDLARVFPIDGVITSTCYKIIKIYNVTMKDFLQIFPGNSLRQIASAWGIPIQKKHFDHRWMNRETIIQNEGLREFSIRYCIIDCVVLALLVCKFWEICIEHKVDHRNIHTAAGLAKSVFIKFMDVPILRAPKDRNVIHLMRKFLVGGQVQVIQNISLADKIVGLDFTSLYPSILYNYEMPTDFTGQETYNFGQFHLPSVQNKIKIKEFTFYLIVKCRLKDNIKFPPFAVRTERGELFYPRGWDDMQGIWGFQLLNFYEDIDSCEIIGELRFEHAFIARTYVKHFYEKRRETDDEALKQFYKILLNSLYGQMARKFVPIMQVFNREGLINLTTMLSDTLLIEDIEQKS